MSSLPKLMLIADGFASGRCNQSAEQVRRRVLELVAEGVSFVQCRDHEATKDLFRSTAARLVQQIHELRPNAVITINSREDIAAELGCGLHLRAGESASLQRRDNRPRGCSTHDLDEVRQAERTGFEYVTFSPVFSTQTHPQKVPLGIDALRDLCASATGLHVFALGGINPNRGLDCLNEGAYGVAVLSDLLDSNNPSQRLAEFRDASVL